VEVEEVPALEEVGMVPVVVVSVLALEAVELAPVLEEEVYVPVAVELAVVEVEEVYALVVAVVVFWVVGVHTQEGEVWVWHSLI
jgi:hypothetical protein